MVVLEVFVIEVFQECIFVDVKIGIGVVVICWMIEKLMIFKGSVVQVYGCVVIFVLGFGVILVKVVQVFCLVFLFFECIFVIIVVGDYVELVDGGYCVNNFILYVIVDVVVVLGYVYEDLCVVSIGVGVYLEFK